MLAELTGLVCELRGQLEAARRAASRNSGNSSMPPSQDGLPGRKAPAPRAKPGSGRRPAKQPGALGAHLAWSQTPDETVALFPEGSCPCGLELTGAADLGVVASRQVIDVPLAAATVTQYDEHAVRCGCGKVHEAAAVPGAGRPGTVAWGLNVQALAVFLLVMHHVPVERCAGILEALTGERPSDGFVHLLLERAARAVGGACLLIRALVVAARVVCADETPIRVGPGPKTRKRYLLAACTNLLTCYFLGDRSLSSFDGFVLGDLPAPSRSTTATGTTTPTAPPRTSCAARTSCETSPTPPSSTRTRSGQARPPTRSAPSSTPRTPPAARD